MIRNLVFNKRRNGGMRLLTLLCFFHFTGINNGFTYFVVSSGRIERVDLAAICLQKWVAVMHPLAWKRALLEGGWRDVFFRSGGVIRQASRRTLKNVMFESTLFEVWAKGACTKIVNGPPKVRAQVQGAVERASSPDLLDGTQAAERLAGMNCVAGFLKDRWLAGKRFGIWDAERYGLGEAVRSSKARFWRELQVREKDVRMRAMRDRMRPPGWGTALGLQGRPLLVFSSDAGEDAPHLLIVTRDFQDDQPQVAADFFRFHDQPIRRKTT